MCLYDELEQILSREVGTNASQTIECLRGYLGGQSVYFPARRNGPKRFGTDTISVAAKHLGVARSTLYRKLK